MSIGKFNWKSVEQAANQVAKWPEWKRKYRIGTVENNQIGGGSSNAWPDGSGKIGCGSGDKTMDEGKGV